MTRKILLGILALSLVALVGCRQDDPTLEPEPGEVEGPAEGPSVTIEMRALNDSGQSGTATLTDEEGQTRVVVELANSPAGPQPIHIHPGPCADLDPAPQYPLTNLSNGRSETVVEVSLEDLLAGTFAINAHKSPEEVQIYVSCGDILE